MPAERTEAIRAALHHKHLPKLADAGLVAYDPETKTVTPVRVEELSPVLRATDYGE